LETFKRRSEASHQQNNPAQDKRQISNAANQRMNGYNRILNKYAASPEEECKMQLKTCKGRSISLVSTFEKSSTPKAGFRFFLHGDDFLMILQVLFDLLP
jgi:hypothetical protein